jgi:hypothetical protein
LWLYPLGFKRDTNKPKKGNLTMVFFEYLFKINEM